MTPSVARGAGQALAEGGEAAGVPLLRRAGDDEILVLRVDQDVADLGEPAEVLQTLDAFRSRSWLQRLGERAASSLTRLL